MEHVIKRIKLDLYSPAVYETVRAQQGDNDSRVIEFELYDQGEPYAISPDISFRVEGIRGNRSSFISQNCGVRDHIVSFVLTNDILKYAGTIKAKLVMRNGTDTLSTTAFNIYVEKSYCDREHITDEDLSMMDTLLTDLADLNSLLSVHTADQTNPHKVTLAQLGSHTHTKSEITDFPTVFSGATSKSNGSNGFVPAPLAENASAGAYLSATGQWEVPVGTVYSAATTSANGLMSASDKSKLNEIAEKIGTLNEITAELSDLNAAAAELSNLNPSRRAVGSRYGDVPYIDDDGYMDIGKYLDWHSSDNAGTNDHNARQYLDGSVMYLSGAQLKLQPAANEYPLLLDGTANNGAYILFSNGVDNSSGLRQWAMGAGGGTGTWTRFGVYDSSVGLVDFYDASDKSHRCDSFVAHTNNYYSGNKDYKAVLTSVSPSTSTVTSMSMATSGSTNYLALNTGLGGFGVTIWTSDTKLKKNIEPAKTENTLDLIDQLNFIQFDWKDHEGHVPLGLSANELETVIPDAVFEVQTDTGLMNDEEKQNIKYDSLKNIDHSVMTVYALKAIQDLHRKNKALEKELENIKTVLKSNN